MGFRENIRKPLWVNSVASIICWLQWAQGRLSCTDAKLKCVLWCDEVTFKLFFKNHGYCVPMAWITCTSVKATLMPKGTNRFWSNICCQPDKVFFTNIPAYNDKQHSADVRTVWLRSKRLLNWPACSPDLPSTESVWCIVKCKIQRRRPHWATNTSGNWCPQFPNTYWVL